MVVPKLFPAKVLFRKVAPQPGRNKTERRDEVKAKGNIRTKRHRGNHTGKVNDFPGLLSNDILKGFLIINSSVFWRWIWGRPQRSDSP